MAQEQAISNEPSKEDLAETVSVREVLKLLIKAQKALRLYQAGNAISVRLQTELVSRMSAHLDTHGPFALTIREFHILLGEDPVYEGHDRNDSLAFLLFRDGIRRLTFHPGIEPKELQDFLACLNHVSVLSNDHDDLVTLLWEMDFQAIQYYAVEELAAETEGPRLQDQLASGSLDGGGGGGAPADAVSLKDIEQPAAYLPVDACRLSEEEIEALRSELTREESAPFSTAVVELAIELTLLETLAEEQKSLVKNLVSILNRLLSDGKLEEVCRALEHLQGLAKMVFPDSGPVRHLSDSATRFLSSPEPLERFLELVEGHRSLKPFELTAYLLRLDKTVFPALISWMGRMVSPTHRRGVTEAILAMGGPVLSEMERHLLVEGETPDAAFLREASYALAHSPATQALPLLEKLLRSPHSAVRREMVSVVARFRDSQADTICLNLTADPDPEVRSTALDTLVRRGSRELAEAILERSAGAPDFEQRSLGEKRRVFAAVAKLGGAGVLERLVSLLHLDQRRWFASKRERETREAVIHGIRMVGTEKARHLLHQIADKGDRSARAASLKELAATRKT